MSYIGNSPGLAKRQLFRYIATANQSAFGGSDVNSLTLNYTPGLEDVFLNGFYIPPANYTGDGSIITFNAPLLEGDEVSISAAGAYNPADTLSMSQNGFDILNKATFRQAIQTPMAAARSLAGYMVNPAFEFSMEKDITPSSITTAGSVYYMDQWQMAINGSSVIRGQQVTNNLSATPSFRSFAFGGMTTVTTTQASFSASEYMVPHQQPVEGINTIDLAWGTADAKAIDVVFVITASVAGTYSLAVRNDLGTRSYVTTFNLLANTPSLIFKTIPGETTGTWKSNNTIGIGITIGSAAGTTYHAPVLNAWNANNYITHPSCTNMAATLNATLTLNYCNFFQSGILPYTETNTSGLLPLLAGLRRTYDEELKRCQRYYCELPLHARGGISGVGSSGVQAMSPFYFPSIMRTLPTAVVKTAGTSVNVNIVGTNVVSPVGGFLSIDSAAAGDFYTINRNTSFIARM